MATIQQQIAQAKAAGYSDAEITKHLASTPDLAPKIKAATDAGYSAEQIVAHLSGQGDVKAPDPTADMSEFEKSTAGIGKAIVDTGRGLGQIVGLVSRKDVEDARKRDAALMDTGAGLAGNIAGNIGMALLPGGALKGASIVANAAKAPAVAQTLAALASASVAPKTISGAATLGTIMGAIQPSASTGETLANMALGATTSAAAPVAVRGYQAAKSAAEPFYEVGKNRIIGRVLNRVAGDQSNDAMTAMRNAQELVPGSMPTAGQSAGNAGIAALERTASQTDPQVMNAYTQRMGQQNTARVAALENIAGSEAGRDAAVKAREDAAEALYGMAFKSDAMRRDLAKSAADMRAPFSGVGLTDIPEDLATPGLRELAKRPDFKRAADLAKTLAANKGVDLKDPLQSLEGLHYIKLALDDMANPGAMNPIGKNANAAINDMRSLLANELEKVAPLYGNARQTFAEMSKPINQMDIGTELLDKGVNKLTENMQPGAYAKALSDNTAIRATGFQGATLENTLEPTALRSLASIKDDLARANFAQTAGRGIGSDTLQKLAYSNIIDAAGVPTFLRNMAPTQFLGNLASRGADALYGRANKELSTKLAETMMNPHTAAELMQMGPLESSQILELLSRGGATAGMMVPGLLNGSKQ